MGAAEEDDDDEPFEIKMERLIAELRNHMRESEDLNRAIWVNLEAVGYGN